MTYLRIPGTDTWLTDAICQQFGGETQRFNRNGDPTTERRDEYDHLWPRNPDLKELKKNR